MKKGLLFLLLCAFAFSISTTAQTFTATGGAIPDAGPVMAFPIAVSGLSPATIDTNFGLETVCININHTYDADLIIQLQAPDGTVVTLSMNNGGGDDNYTATCFNQNNPNLISAGAAPFTGTFRPSGQLGNINNGQAGNGTWNLLVQDQNGQDSGALMDVTLTFCPNPAVPFVFRGGHLPIVLINTNGSTIADDPKVPVRMGIIDNGAGNTNHLTDPWNGYNGWAGIEYRGSSSQGFPQKSFGFETWDSLGAEVKVSMLGMPSESDWILYAPYNDKTLMRNVLTYELARQMGHYAPRTRFCELVLDGQYQGIYVLMEQIKRNANRVNIAKLKPQDTAGDALTGGYIVQIDRNTSGWASTYRSPYGANGQQVFFSCEYPKQADLMPQQADYIHNYVDSFENALADTAFTDTLLGYRRFCNVPSFIDYFLINEASRNVDGYRLSTFLYKDKDSKGGKLSAGPVWDYNLAWWNADYCNGAADTGWAYNFALDCPQDGNLPPFWWGRFREDTAYNNALKCRWDTLRRSILDTAFLYRFLDSTAAYIDTAAIARHFNVWPILSVYTWPNPSPLAADFPGELQNMKDWIGRRINWLDSNMPGTCWPPVLPPPPPPPQAVNNQGTISGAVYPNPFFCNLSVDVEVAIGGKVEVSLISPVGVEVWRAALPVLAGTNHLLLQTGRLPVGPYVLKISGAGVKGQWKVGSGG